MSVRINWNGNWPSKKRRWPASAMCFLERIAGLQKQVASISSGELDAVNSQVVALERLDEQRDEKTRTLQAQKERRSALKGRLGVLRDEGTTLNQRLERLGRLAAADGAVCPLCGQALTAEHRDDTLATMGAERDAKREDYRSCVAEIQQIEIDSRAQQQEVEDLAAQLKHLPSLQQKKGALQKQLANARAAESALETETNQLRQIEAQLDDKAYGAELRRQLQQINAQREAISYDAASHADNRTQLENLKRLRSPAETTRICPAQFARSAESASWHKGADGIPAGGAACGRA